MLFSPQPQIDAILPARMFRAGKRASRKNLYETGERAGNFYAQALRAPRKNAVLYGESAPGATIFGYVGANPVIWIDPLGLRALTQEEAEFLNKYYGKCLDPNKIDIELNVLSSVEYQPAPDQFQHGGKYVIYMLKRDFIGGNLNNGIDLSNPATAGVFGHESLHILQRINGVNVDYDSARYHVYDYPSSADPNVMLSIFNNGHVERQGQMMQDYITGAESGQDVSRFSKIGNQVKGCQCGN